MTEVISVRFNQHGKIYYFDPGDIEVKSGDTVIVETAKGLDIGNCAVGVHYVEDTSIIPPLRPLIRVATEDDLKVAEDNKLKEKEAFAICKQKIQDHGLDMKLVDVECSFEGNKILFFFTSEGRVDFRELVKDLASVFRTRIELRQIGVRDETKLLGGLGICGRPYCCNQFLTDFEPVSTKMAKTQSMSLNPTKISGSCGRLMCCLRYEQEAYEELVKTIPKIGAFVETTEGYGNVVQTNVLRQKVKVRIDKENGDQEIKLFDADQVAAIPGGRPKPGEPLPHVLEYVPKNEPDEPEDDPWQAPVLFADTSEFVVQEDEEPAKKPEPQQGNKKKRNPNNKPKAQNQQQKGSQSNEQKKQNQNQNSKQEKNEDKAPRGEQKKSNPDQHKKSSGKKPHNNQHKGKSQKSQQPKNPESAENKQNTSRNGGNQHHPNQNGHPHNHNHHPNQTAKNNGENSENHTQKQQKPQGEKKSSGGNSNHRRHYAPKKPKTGGNAKPEGQTKK